MRWLLQTLIAAGVLLLLAAAATDAMDRYNRPVVFTEPGACARPYLVHFQTCRDCSRVDADDEYAGPTPQRCPKMRQLLAERVAEERARLGAARR